MRNGARWIIIGSPIAALTSCGTVNRSNPFAELEKPFPGNGRIVVVSASRGIGCQVGTDGIPTSMLELHPGGSLKFELPSGFHTIDVKFSGSMFVPNELREQVHLVDGETLWFAVSVSGPLETARMNSHSGYSSSLQPMNSPRPIQILLVPVSAEKAARIAVY